MNFKKFSTSDNQWYDVPYYQHKTATDTLTLPAVIYPNDTSITVGIKGQSSQSGAPSPQSPVDVNGTGERTGNLFDSNILLEAVTWTKNNNVYSGNSSALHSEFNSFDNCIPVNATVATVNLKFRYINLSTSFFIVFWYTDGTSANTKASTVGAWTNISATSDSNKTLKGIAFSFGTNDLMEIKEIMVNQGSTALPYEPYGYKIPILIGGTTINKYLGEVQTVRQIKKLVLTGQEDWKNSSSDNTKFYLDTISPDYLRADSQITYMCTHYIPYDQTVSAILVPNMNMSMSSGTAQRLYLADANFTTVDQFKTYLQRQYAAAIPVTVYYVLSTPTTATVNEPLMKIGNYADSLTTSIPCTAGENTLDVQTTVQPSEVTANYQGWHPVQSVHERENGQWD